MDDARPIPPRVVVTDVSRGAGDPGTALGPAQSHRRVAATDAGPAPPFSLDPFSGRQLWRLGVLVPEEHCG